MLESEKRAIGNTTFEVFQLGSLSARKTLVRLTKAFGPVLGKLLGELGLENGASPEAIKERLSVKVIGTLADSLAEHISEADLEYLCETFGKASFYYEGDKRLQLTLERQELLFKGGNLLTMFKWLAFCLEVNYADFFVAWGRAKVPQPQAARDTLESPSPLT